MDDKDFDEGYDDMYDTDVIVEKDSGSLANEKKRARARDYARRKRKELVYVKEKAVLIYNELVRMGAYSQLSDMAKEFFDVYIHREVQAQYPYPPLMYKMFGKVIAPGASCTLREAMQRLYKGKNEINFLVRRWGEKNGVHVSVELEGDKNVLDTRYVITHIDPIEEASSVDNVSEFMSKREQGNFREYESLK